MQFEVASAKSFPGDQYDLIAFFDCLHDMGDPAGAAAHVRKVLKPEGTWMIVEPFAEDSPEANHNPVGRIFYSASTMLCVPASMAQEVGAALGAQAGEARLREVVTSGGKPERHTGSHRVSSNDVIASRCVPTVCQVSRTQATNSTELSR